MKKGFPECRAGCGEINRGGRLIPLGDRQGPNVVQVGVGDNDRIGAIVGNLLVSGEGIWSFLLGVHSGIQENRGPVQIESVGVSTDLGSKIKGLE
jgi:hypothetical protein